MLDTVDACSMLCRLEMEGKIRAGVAVHKQNQVCIKQIGKVVLFLPFIKRKYDMSDKFCKRCKLLLQMIPIELHDANCNSI